MSPLELQFEQGTTISEIPRVPRKESELESQTIVVTKDGQESIIQVDHAPTGGKVTIYKRNGPTELEVVESNKRMVPPDTLAVESAGVKILAYKIDIGIY